MEADKDEFRGFEDGFNGFPKRLPDDCVEYSLFVIDARLKSQRELLSRLEAVRKEAVKLAESLLKDYIWQRDGFKLEVENSKGLMYLHGLTNYGDAVDDEWLVVYLLRELSNRYSDLWIRVVDVDGEFLLIEAANALPRWLNPEIADHRVWIHANDLRIIPLSAAPTTSSAKETAPVSRSLSLDEAHKTIASNPGILIHSPLIEAEAFYRLQNYPSQITASLHYATITIPRKLAYILHGRAASIAPATEAFYLRDPIALKPLQSISSNLVFPPEDHVTISVRFTKVLYAQLKSQQFSPPIAWKAKLAEAEENSSSTDLKQKRYPQLEMGMKVTSGFEMLITDPKNRDKHIVREIKLLLDDLDTDEEDLPTDEEISRWEDVAREDDEKWLDINFEDFERELAGNPQEKKPSIPGAFGPESPPGFGDAKTQADLKKMVERFESFLNDNEAGIDGAEMDEMDFDDDEGDSEEDSEDEDKDVSFDENEFARMMREMMGLPSDEDGVVRSDTEGRPATTISNTHRIEELGSDEDEVDEEANEIQKLMLGMERELNEAGALNLDPTPNKVSTLGGKTPAAEASNKDENWEDESDGENVDIDFNLAKNLLESFKSQAGMPGPGSNLMGLMGMQLPRDEDEHHISKPT
ncbi:Uncharacterized protein BP5553_08961 [Venustampulla echinocandica]|uniref:Uncharacterized protein n=1 Tax=Venustampulla echinocandica TaxID=2656787 RepID=A0A370TDH6_9HELO|nr:Uncharacterized protein BP5553_08961 [Venustampulla echinocandica]RDL32505.1 Uncharacterized protein BP5553_08961 [Venustampulla echinocandica]